LWLLLVRLFVIAIKEIFLKNKMRK